MRRYLIGVLRVFFYVVVVAACLSIFWQHVQLQGLKANVQRLTLVVAATSATAEDALSAAQDAQSAGEAAQSAAEDAQSSADEATSAAEDAADAARLR